VAHPQSYSFQPTTNNRVPHPSRALRRVGKLLRECKSVKVKRLFLWYADRHGHAWFKHLDQTSIDLGKGKRQLVPQGHFDSRYQITLPMKLFNAGGSNDGQ
jgi:Transcriptional regulator, AbiEi antitoxin, Type IV TA system